MTMLMLVQVMEKTLSKLATFDEGSMMGSMLGFVVSNTTVMMTMMMDKHQFQHVDYWTYLLYPRKFTCHFVEQENQCDWVWN